MSSCVVTGTYSVTQKSKPPPNDQKIVLNRIEACHLDN